MKRVFKWIGITLGTLVILACAAIYGVSEYRLTQTFDIAAAPIAIPTDSASLDRGLHIVQTRGCAGCHLVPRSIPLTAALADRQSDRICGVRPTLSTS